MKNIHLAFPTRTLALLAVVAVATFNFSVRAVPFQGYTVTNLVSDEPILATNVDANLLNPWGLTFDESGDPIVADNADSLATFYGPDGTVVPFSINAGTAPTGIEYNIYTNDFLIGPSTNPVPAELLICTESGTVLGFSLAVSFNTAVVTVNDSASSAVYTGLTVAQSRGKQYLYVADFYNAKIKVYDSKFNFVGSFTDPHMTAGFAPYNVRNIAGFLFVTFAKQSASPTTFAQAGAGNGFVEIFTPDGILIERLVSHGELNSPWGITYVPFTFGKFGSALLVGNNGDGRINAYDPIFGNFLGTLDGTTGAPITIPGLWSLSMTPHIDAAGDDDCDNPANNNLYFTSGPGQTNGIVGLIQPAKH
jgi:uncharacterized protein (TIGR03118 family)